jgi:hypothetical protein
VLAPVASESAFKVQSLALLLRCSSLALPEGFMALLSRSFPIRSS